MAAEVATRIQELEKYVSFTDKGLELADDTPYAVWERIGGVLQEQKQLMDVYLGDWLNFGERRWGQRYTQAVKVTGLGVGTLMNTASIARRMEPEARILGDGVTFSHWAPVAKLDGPDVKKDWLLKAQQGGWSCQRLRREIDLASGVQKVYADPYTGEGTVTFETLPDGSERVIIVIKASSEQGYLPDDGADVKFRIVPVLP